MITANETADRQGKIRKGIYLMTDTFGNQRRVKVVPAEKSLFIEMIEPAPRLKTNQNYDDFLYKKGSIRLKYADSNLFYYWDDTEFKLYAKDDSDPLYFEFQNRV